MADSATTPEKERLINPAHLTGSALAAGAATAAASYFGVAGTIIGAVAASVVATIVSATSTHSLKKWPKLGLFGAGVLMIVMVTVTSVEGIAGRPLSSLLGGSDAESGTTIGRTVKKPAQEREPAQREIPKSTVTPSPSPSAPTTPPGKMPQTQAPEPTPTPDPTTPATPTPTPTPGTPDEETGSDSGAETSALS